MKRERESGGGIKVGLLGEGERDRSIARRRQRNREELKHTSHTHTYTHRGRMLKLVELSPYAVGSSVRLSVSYCIPDNSLSCFDLSLPHQKVECSFHNAITVEWRWKLEEYA